MYHNNDITTTEYLDGFQYIDEDLQFFPTSEGYVRKTEVGVLRRDYYDYIFIPSNNFKFDIMFYYIYILKSEVDGKFYTGYTSNLKLRLEQHDKGLVSSTKSRRPLKLIYFEGCLNQQDATKREKYLKTHYGKMFLRNRLKSYLTG